MNFYFVLILVLLSVTCSSGNGKVACGVRPKKKASSRIVGGTESVAHSWPWMVAIAVNKGVSCGGALISDRMVVSAAHCFPPGVPASSYLILVGGHDLSQKVGQVYGVESISNHPSFKSPNIYNDIAVLRTKTVVTFNANVVPICLPSKDMGNLEGKEGYVAGWGTTSSGGKSSRILRELKVPVVSRTKCSQNYRNGLGLRQGIIETQFCAGFFSGGKDSCQGDSGGPMMMSTNGGKTWTLAGVVSFGKGCAEKNYPGVYTRVDKFLLANSTGSRAATRMFTKA